MKWLIWCVIILLQIMRNVKGKKRKRRQKRKKKAEWCEESVELNKGLLSVFEESKDILKKIGFDLSHFGGNAILVNGLPPDIKNNTEQEVIENMLDDIANAKGNVTESYHEFVATSLANNASVNANVIMEKEVQLAFVNQLLKCKNPNFSPEGLPTVVRINDEMLFDMFRKGKV